MDATEIAPAPGVKQSTGPAGHSLRATGLVVSVVILVAAAWLSVSVGAKTIPLGDVWRLVFSPDGSENGLIVQDVRLPRTALAILVGAALGAAGALMQAITRNPLADPGLLGVNAGAALAVVSAMAFLGVATAVERIPFAFAGAALASLLVYALGATGRAGASPVRLALSGVAVTAACIAMVQSISLLDPDVFNSYRFWAVGSLAGASWGRVVPIAPFIAAGLALALVLGRPLNALALGEDASRALGARPARTRAAGAVAIVLLCGGATAVAGPIYFVGLAVPLMVRSVTGPDQRWLIPYSIVLAPVMMLVSDVLARVVDRPAEVAAGIICAFLGAPVFIALVRRRRIGHL